MSEENAPVRITKQRAHALMIVAEIGIESEIDSLKQMHGVKLNRDGTLAEITADEFELVEPADHEEIQERIETITRAIDTLGIFARRYG